MSLFEIFVVAALATYRLTAMIHNETGPKDIFGRFRNWAGVKFDQYSNPYGTGWLSDGILCFYCLSVWIGFGVSVLIVLTAIAGFPLIGSLLLFPFALSGLAVFLKKWTG